MLPVNNLLRIDQVCSRWIPPGTFVPVALPIDTTYVEVDSCTYLNDGTPFCSPDAQVSCA